MSEHEPFGAPEAQTEVRVAIVGVGNCASSLVQGVEYYHERRRERRRCRA